MEQIAERGARLRSLQPDWYMTLAVDFLIHDDVPLSFVPPVRDHLERGVRDDQQITLAVLPVQQVLRNPPDCGLTLPGVADEAGDPCLQFGEAPIGIARDLFGQATAWYCDAGLRALDDAVTGGGRRIKCLAAAAKRAIRVDNVHVVAFLKYPIKLQFLKSRVPLLHPLPQGRDSLRVAMGLALGTRRRENPDLLFIPYLQA